MTTRQDHLRDLPGGESCARGLPHSGHAPAAYPPLRAGWAFTPGHSGDERMNPLAAPKAAYSIRRNVCHEHPDPVREGPRRHLRHHLARRRAVPRRHHDASRRSSKSPSCSTTMGVDIIEAGFPIASDGDFDAVNEIAKRAKNAVICGLSRALAEGHRPLRRGDQAGQAQAHPHLPLHLAGAHEIQAAEGAARGLRDGDRAGDARAAATPTTSNGRPRTAPAPSSISSAAASKPRSRPAPPRSISPTPSATRCRRNTPTCSRWCASACRIPTRRVFSVHCHNDLGMAVANSLAGVEGGARQIECSDQRHRRARRQRRAGRGRHGDAHAQRRAAVLDRHRRRPCSRAPRSSSRRSPSFPVQYNKAIVGAERLRPRERHPPGRHAQARRRPTRS